MNNTYVYVEMLLYHDWYNKGLEEDVAVSYRHASRHSNYNSDFRVVRVESSTKIDKYGVVIHSWDLPDSCLGEPCRALLCIKVEFDGKEDPVELLKSAMSSKELDRFKVVQPKQYLNGTALAFKYKEEDY